MSVLNTAGTTLSESALNALTANPPAPPVMRVVTADILQRFSFQGAGGFERGQRLLFTAGQIVPQAVIDALFLDATVTGVALVGGGAPSGPAAGGTDVIITGTNFGGVLGVTIGGVAATQVRALSETQIACRTPAHATGAVAVVVTDDSGAVTLANGFTYV